MSDDAGEAGSGDPQDSPYRPPVIVDESGELPPAREFRRPIPVLWVGLYALVASGLTGFAMFLPTAAASTAVGLWTIFGVPMLLVGLFSGMAYTVATAKSAAWKVGMTVISAPLSMIVFVPTCTASAAVFLPMPTIGFGFFISCFFGYFVTCYLIAMFARSRAHRADDLTNR